MRYRLIRHPLFFSGALIALLFLFIVLSAPLISPHDPLATDLQNILKAPGKGFPLGTDNLGRCVLSRLIAGSRITLGAALAIELLVFVTGTLIGIGAGYYGGALDGLILILIDIFLAFPSLILALVTAGLLGPGIGNLIFAFAAVYWVEHARIARSVTRSLREREFVLASRVSGSRSWGIVRRHILPHVLPNMLVLSALTMPQIIIGISSMSFIGLGVKPPAPEWGMLLSEGRTYLRENPAMLIAGILCITLSAASFQFLGESLRDVLHPRTSHLRPQLSASKGGRKC